MAAAGIERRSVEGSYGAGSAPEQEAMLTKCRNTTSSRRGELTFPITRPWASVQRSWTDGKERRVEDCLGNVWETFSVVAREEHERRRKHAEEQQRKMDLQRRRWEEEARVRRLDEQLQRKKAVDVREYAQAVEAAVVDRPGQCDPEGELGK